MEKINLDSLKVADDNEQTTTDTLEEIPESQIEHDKDVDEEMFSQDRRRLILLIQFPINEFPERLRMFKKKDLEDLSKTELQSLLSEMQYTLGAKSNVRAAVGGMTMAIVMIEQLSVFTPLKLQGLSAITQNPDVIDDMKLIALKYTDLIHVEPEARLGMKILSAALGLHQINTAKEAQNKHPMKSKEVDDKLDNISQNEEFSML